MRSVTNGLAEGLSFSLPKSWATIPERTELCNEENQAIAATLIARFKNPAFHRYEMASGHCRRPQEKKALRHNSYRYALTSSLRTKSVSPHVYRPVTVAPPDLMTARAAHGEGTHTRHAPGAAARSSVPSPAVHTTYHSNPYTTHKIPMQRHGADPHTAAPTRPSPGPFHPETNREMVQLAFHPTATQLQVKLPHPSQFLNSFHCKAFRRRQAAPPPTLPRQARPPTLEENPTPSAGPHARRQQATKRRNR